MSAAWQFGTPEKQSNGSEYSIPVTNPVYLPHDLMWIGGQVQPDIAIQNSVLEMRNSVLKAVIDNQVMFRQPPTLKALQALAFQWGVLLINGICSWGSNNVFVTSADFPTDAELTGKRALIRLSLSSILISRSAIRPVWSISLVKVLSDELIDLVFDDIDGGADESDIQSVGSNDFETDGGNDVVCLQDLEAKKTAAKEKVKELLRLSRQTKLAADEALDRFYAEFDLSDTESDLEDDEMDLDE
jgi:hypothetical protein